MRLSKYVEEATTFAVYPITTTKRIDYAYLVLGLIGELHELCNESYTFRNEAAVLSELGDVMWYIARLIDTFDIDAKVVAALAWNQAENLPEAHSPNHRVYLAEMKYAADALADPAKKTIRNDGYTIDKAMVIRTVCTILARISRIAQYFGASPERVMGLNIEKLKHRQEQNTLAGDGHGRDK
jgi:NTP pyrophosphatase (non-canonical NTP hydrolase)